MMRHLRMNPTVVRDRDGDAVADLGAPGARVERREQPVLDQRRGPGELLEQCALAGVGVADESDGRELGAPLALHLALALDQIEPLAQRADAAPDDAAVALELGLATPRGADPAGLPGEVRPARVRRDIW